MQEDENEAYIGTQAIFKHINQNKHKYKNNKNIDTDSINYSFITRTLKEHDLSKPHKKRVKGCSRHQNYPEKLINSTGNLILEIDFIQKFIKGRTKPVHFIGFSCKKLKFRQYRRISDQTGENVRKELEWFFNNFFVPDVVKMDNDLAFIGSRSAKKTISKVAEFLLKKGIIPIFTNPRNPWNNGSIEGSNSVFGKNFWNRFDFISVKEVDIKLCSFNRCSLKHSDYEQNKFQDFEKNLNNPKIYFIRKVCEGATNVKGEIDVLNEKIILPKGYINLYTFSEWNLKSEILYIYFEKDQDKKLIKKIQFKINKNSKFQL